MSELTVGQRVHVKDEYWRGCHFIIEEISDSYKLRPEILPSFAPEFHLTIFDKSRLAACDCSESDVIFEHRGVKLERRKSRLIITVTQIDKGGVE